MEGYKNSSAATSRPFRFIVGPNAKEFSIHSALVAKQSHVLNVLVNGGMRESIDYVVQWEDIDESTFTSFWQFVYTGDYDTPPEPAPTNLNHIYITPTANAKENGSRRPFLSKRKYTLADSRVKTGIFDWNIMLLRIFRSGCGLLDPPNRAQAFLPTVDRSIACAAEILIHHARVFILADRYQVEWLAKLALGKLHSALLAFAPIEDNLAGVVALLRFTYEELVPDTLRELVSYFAASRINSLRYREDFEQVAQDYEKLPRDMLEHIVNSLNGN